MNSIKNSSKIINSTKFQKNLPLFWYKNDSFLLEKKQNRKTREKSGERKREEETRETKQHPMCSDRSTADSTNAAAQKTILNTFPHSTLELFERG